MNLNKLFEEIADKNLNSYLSLSCGEKLEKAITEQLDENYSGIIEVPILDNPNILYHAEFDHGEKIIGKEVYLENGKETSLSGDDNYKARMEAIDMCDRVTGYIGADIAKRYNLKEKLKDIAKDGWNLIYNNRGYENGIEEVKIYHEKFPRVPIFIERFLMTPREARE